MTEKTKIVGLTLSKPFWIMLQSKRNTFGCMMWKLINENIKLYVEHWGST